MNEMNGGNETMQKIVVVEFPKSGASWFVTMIGHALSIPVRDIYVRDDSYSHVFDIRKHPWYENTPELGITDVCVIKSHEMPGSQLHDFRANYIHMVRDGRDVIVSKYFFEKEFCLKNGIIQSFGYSLDEFIEKTAKEWAEYVGEWLEFNLLTCKYEQLLVNPEEVLKKLFDTMGYRVSSESLVKAVSASSKKEFSKSLDKAFTHNTFVRKGIAGDWLNHFTEKHKEIFKPIAGELLIKLGYESDLNW